MSEPRLVYVDESWAYFTTRPDWQNQWGDDWDDAPYECNAGSPYTWADYMSDVEPYDIVKVAFDADVATPDDGHLNSPFSVQMVNAGQIAWLRSRPWFDGDPCAAEAGISLDEFKAFIERVGGSVYEATKS